MVRHYNFGIEIEAVARPYGGGGFSNVDWYRQLAQKLRNRGVSAVHDDCSRYSKHPEYDGGKWFVTRDGSLKRPRPFVCMEVVSSRLDTAQPVSRTVTDFWEAMRVHFDPQRDASCGGHVHVTPVGRRNRFSLRALKAVAFATVAYEDYVAAVLAPPRRDNQYCVPNSLSPRAGLRDALACATPWPAASRRPPCAASPPTSPLAPASSTSAATCRAAATSCGISRTSSPTPRRAAAPAPSSSAAATSSSTPAAPWPGSPLSWASSPWPSTR